MNLAGQLLVAMPAMDDPRFVRAVIFICAYSEEGAMGLIVNKRAGDMTMGEVFSRLDVNAPGVQTARAVQYGGPVDQARGFVLHRDLSRLVPDAMAIRGQYVLSATQDVLEDIAAGTGPDPYLFALGYAGWGAGQLEGEIAQNGWLTVDATDALVFGTPQDRIWEAALRSMGIDPVTLSGAAGRA